MSKIKQKTCDCDSFFHECCDICTGWEKAKQDGKLKDKKIGKSYENKEEYLKPIL